MLYMFLGISALFAIGAIKNFQRGSALPSGRLSRKYRPVVYWAITGFMLICAGIAFMLFLMEVLH